MEILRLQIKASSFYEILSGQRIQEVCAITPANQNKFLTVTPAEVTMRMYDAISFTSGDKENESEMVLEITNTELDFEPDEEGYVPLYEKDGKLYIEDAKMYYTLGKILEKKNTESLIHKFNDKHH